MMKAEQTLKSKSSPKRDLREESFAFCAFYNGFEDILKQGFCVGGDLTLISLDGQWSSAETHQR